MSNIPSNLLYTADHEWVLVEGSTATIGITYHAQKQLGDVVFVEMPEVGKKLVKEEPFGTVESVKAVSELFAPLTGKVTEINQELGDTPELVNEDPYGDAWMVKMTIDKKDELKELMKPDAYEKHIQQEA
jgi:glycine cleavage system H protein